MFLGLGFVYFPQVFHVAQDIFFQVISVLVEYFILEALGGRFPEIRIEENQILKNIDQLLTIGAEYLFHLFTLLNEEWFIDILTFLLLEQSAINLKLLQILFSMLICQEAQIILRQWTDAFDDC